MRHLKIAVVVGKFPTVSETFIINQMGFLKKSGHQIQILCLGEKNSNFVGNDVVEKFHLMKDTHLFTWHKFMPYSKLLRLKKMFGILFKTKNSRIFWKLIQSLNVLKYGLDAIKLNQFFKAYYQYYFVIEEFDVLHIHFADNAMLIWDQISQFKNKLVVTFHGYDAHKFDSNYYSRLIKRESIHYTVNTKYTEQKIIDLGFPKEKISILAVGLDTQFFSPNKKEHTSFNVLFVGRLIEFKSPISAIKIIESLKTHTTNQIHLNIIGSGDEASRCQKYISDHNLNDYISLLGAKTQNEIRDYMNISDVFLYPGIIDKSGRCENQGLVIQEAQSMEIPVIISDVGGMHYGMIDKESGYVIRENDLKGFEERLLHLILHPNEMQRMGKAGRKFVAKNYDNEVIGQQLLELYGSPK